MFGWFSGKKFFFALTSCFIFASLSFLNSCKNKNKPEGEKDFFVKVEPQEGTYPQYDTMVATITSTKDAQICYTVREKDNPDPCEREYVYKIRVKANEPVTIPFTPEFNEGATDGVFYLRILATSKDGERFMTEKFYRIILKPFITINPKGGFYPREITVAVGCNKPCFLYYTTDGTEPKKESAKKEENGFILKVSQDIKLQVFAEDKELGLKSEIIKQEYFIDKSPPETSVLGIESCKCLRGCDKKIPDVVRCKNPITVSLIASDDKSPTIDIFWSVDGFPPSDDAEKLYQAGGNTFKAKNSADVAIKSHTILKFFSKDIAGNKEDIKTVIVLIGETPFAYAEPPGGVFGSASIPLEVKIFAIPEDALISYQVSFPDATTSSSDSCQSPCKIILEKEGKNIIVFRAYKGGLADQLRRADFILDKTPPRVFFEPANCFSDAGPISASIRSDEEKTKIFWKICEKGTPGCSLTDCVPNAPDTLSGTAPVTGVTIDVPSDVYFCGIDLAGNKSEISKIECEVSGKYIEEFDNQDNMDDKETTAQWGNGKLVLKKDSITQDGSVDTQGAGTLEIDVADKTAFLVDSNSTLKIIDISTPSSPGIISQIGVTSAVSLALWHDVLFVLSSSELSAYDVSNRRSPRKIGSANLSADFTIPSGQANHIKVWGKYIIISAGNQGVVIVKIKHDWSQSSRSITFERVGGIQPSSNAAGVSSQKIDVFGDLVAVAENTGGLRIVSIEKPSSPRQITSISDFLQSGERAVSVKFFFPYVAVGTNNGNLYIFDASEPRKTKLVSSLLLASGIQINDIDQWGILLVISDNQGVKFVDVRDPANPALLYDLRRGGTLSSFVYGDRLLAGDINSGLYIYKIAEPFDTAYEMKVVENSGVRSVGLYGTLSVAGKESEVKFFLTNNPFSPSHITSITGSNITAFSLWGDKVVVGDGTFIKIYSFPPTDVPIKEVDLSSLRSGIYIWEIVNWGDSAIVAGEKAAFLVPLTDIENLTPDKVLKFEGSYSIYDVDISGDILFISSRDSRVIAVRILDGSFSLLLDNLTSSAVWEIIPFGKYIATAQSISGLIFYDISRIIFGSLAQVGASPLQNVIGVRNFGYFNLVFRGSGISLVDNTYIDRPREVYSKSIKGSKGEIFGDIAFVLDQDGKAKLVRFARGKMFYLSESKAQSKNLTPDLKTSIKDAQLSAYYCETQDPTCDEVGCNISFSVSNNGGLSWVDIVPNAGFFPFGSTGTSLMWRAKLRSPDPLLTPELCKLTINYRFGR